jgi:NAD-dependent DNA ligase
VIDERRNGSEIIINTPEICPSCQTKLEKERDKVRYYCPNSFFCKAQIIEKLIYSV